MTLNFIVSQTDDGEYQSYCYINSKYILARTWEELVENIEEILKKEFNKHVPFTMEYQVG